MRFTTEDEPDLTLPDDSIATARLEEITLREFEWDDRKTGERKSGSNLEWWWTILHTNAGEQFAGRKVRGTCSPKLSNRGDNRFRIWSEALLGREIPVGMEIDTEDLVGLTAEVVVGLEPDRKDPLKKWNRVTDVIGTADQKQYPTQKAFGTAFAAGDPPF